ncbi:MAG: hypothetical protein QGF59_05600, partial [Pirellulaceae bacterium]|nr:hypothetical protein [Pirellulaceae bacterium]
MRSVSCGSEKYTLASSNTIWRTLARFATARKRWYKFYGGTIMTVHVPFEALTEDLLPDLENPPLPELRAK